MLCPPDAAARPHLLAVRRGAAVEAAHAAVGAPEQALDATTKGHDGNDGHDGDQANQQGVLHHGGATLSPRTLEQVAVESADREERIYEQFCHLMSSSALHSSGLLSGIRRSPHKHSQVCNA